MRHKLSNRHSIQITSLVYRDAAGVPYEFQISYSRFPNNNIAEVFVSSGKVGSTMYAMARDIGVALSIMFQSGMLISDLSGSMTQLDNGEPAGPLGAILKKLQEEW